MSSEWQRPESLALPTVWSRVRGLRAMGDGRVPDFWVQCVRPEDDDAVLDIMVKHFLREEETSKVFAITQDKDTLHEFRGMWKKLLAQRVSLAAWTGWPDGKPRIVGCNILYVRLKNDPNHKGGTPLAQKVMRAIYALDNRVDVCERYGVPRYLSAMGLSTLPEFRGQMLGAEILRARVPLCRSLGLKVTATIFTGIASQKQAERAGFRTLEEMRYDSYIDDGEVVFASIKTVEAMQLKALPIPAQD